MRTNTNEYDSFKDLIDESKADLSGFVEKKLELVKLTVYEKASRLFSRLLYTASLIVFALILFFLSLITIALFIGRALQNYPAGFAILLIIILCIMLMVILYRKPLKRTLTNITLNAIKKIEEDED